MWQKISQSSTMHNTNLSWSKIWIFAGLFIFETLYVDVSFLPFVNGSERRWKNFHVSKQRFGQHLIFKIILIHDFFNKVCSRQVLVLNKSRCWLLLFRMGRKGEGGAQDVCWCFFAQCENLWLFLPLRFYVKSISRITEVQKLIYEFWHLEALKSYFNDFLQFFENRNSPKIKIQSSKMQIMAFLEFLGSQKFILSEW